MEPVGVPGPPPQLRACEVCCNISLKIRESIGVIQFFWQNLTYSLELNKYRVFGRGLIISRTPSDERSTEPQVYGPRVAAAHAAAGGRTAGNISFSSRLRCVRRVQRVQ